MFGLTPLPSCHCLSLFCLTPSPLGRWHTFWMAPRGYIFSDYSHWSLTRLANVGHCCRVPGKTPTHIFRNITCPWLVEKKKIFQGKNLTAMSEINCAHGIKVFIDYGPRWDELWSCQSSGKLKQAWFNSSLSSFERRLKHE